MFHIRLLASGLAALLLAGSALAQSVTIDSGNGQVTCPTCTTNPVHSFQELVVVVKDAAGNPVPNTTVTWTVAPAPGSSTFNASVGSATTLTDAAGRSNNTFIQSPPIVAFATYSQANVTATALGVSATFTETTTTAEQNTGVAYISTPTLESPQAGTIISGRLGEAATPPIQIRVRTSTLQGVAGVGVRVRPPANTTYQTTFACQESGTGGLLLTDSTGLATCTVVFGGRPGTGSLVAEIGGNFASTGEINFTAQTGRPWTIRSVSGDNQSGSVGSLLPLPLVATVTDVGGNVLAGTAVTWAVVSGNATLSNQVTTSDANGRVSTYVRPNSSGQVQIRVSANETPNATYTFSASGMLTVSDLQVLSSGQSAAPNTAFPSPLMVEVRNQGVPQANVAVTFAVTSGSATLSSSSAVTDGNGRASVNATAGPTFGPVTVTATVGNLVGTFNLQVRQPGPELTTSSFVNAASFVRGENALSPCGLAQIVAPGLATGIQGVVNPSNLVGPLPLILAGVTIQVGSSYAPIYSVANMSGTESVTFQVPCDVAAGNSQVTVRVGSGSASITVPVQTVSPGVFTFVDTDNRSRAVILRPDGTFASAANPVRRGEIARTYVTGIGPGQPQVGTNSPGIPGVTTNAQYPVIVGVNNAGVRVVSTSLATNLIGVYEVAFEVPGDTAAGNDVPFGFAVDLSGRLVFANGSAIPVQ